MAVEASGETNSSSSPQFPVHAAHRIIRSPWAWVGCAAILVLVLAMKLSAPTGTAKLQVKMQHSFRSAEVTIWVDERIAYTGHLSGVARKRFGLLPTNTVQGSFSQALQVPSGAHNVRVQVSAPSEAFDQTARIEGHFAPNTETEMQISPVRRNNDLTLAFQGVTAIAVGDAGDPWYVKYGGSLVTTILGTVVSAITAFLLKSLPTALRRTSQPKA